MRPAWRRDKLIQIVEADPDAVLGAARDALGANIIISGDHRDRMLRT